MLFQLPIKDLFYPLLLSSELQATDTVRECRNNFRIVVVVEEEEEEDFGRLVTSGLVLCYTFS